METSGGAATPCGGVDADDAGMASPAAHGVPDKPFKHLVIMINSAPTYAKRRSSIRKTWLRYVDLDCDESPLTREQKATIDVCFVIGSPDGVSDAAIDAEQEEHGDLVRVNVKDSYDNLGLKLLAWLAQADQQWQYEYAMHCDDDSFVRLDLLLSVLQDLPRRSVYWGYVWDNEHTRITQPIRDPNNKSHMPVEQYPLSVYPPFCCGCGFILSHDLGTYLSRNRARLRFMRLIDVAVGVWLFPLANVAPMHNEYVRPYRPLPLWRRDTIIQHYMKPSEFMGYWKKSVQQRCAEPDEADERVAQFYAQLCDMGLLKH